MKIKTVIIGLLVIIFISCGGTATTGKQIPTLEQLPTLPPEEVWSGLTGGSKDSLHYYADGMVFSGKVINPNSGEWVNNRLVLLFYKSKEIARGITSTMEYDAEIQCVTEGKINPECNSDSSRLDNNLGIADGIFSLSIPNTYNVDIESLGIPLTESPFLPIREHDGSKKLGVWIDPFNEGDTREFFIPSKNIKYVLKVLPGDLSQLPAEIQQPGSIALLDGNRLVAVDPNAPESAPKSATSNSQARFEQVTEQTTEFPATIFPLNNCGGGAEIKQEITQAYIHEIIDESNIKFGIELPLTDWLKIIFEVEKHYGISDKEITTYSTTLTVPAGQNVEYTVIRKQTWESGIAIVNDGVEISAPYRILKSETYEVTNSQQKSCP